MKMALLFALVGILVLGVPSASAYTIVGDNVFIDDENVYMGATPHTFDMSNCRFSEWPELPVCPVIFTLDSKKYAGDIAAAWGFDTNFVRPISAEIYRNDTWEDLNKEYDVVDKNFDGKNKWYVLRNVTVQKNKYYYVRIWMKVLLPSKGKYDFAIWPAGMNINDSISAGKFYYLDPFWNIPFTFRRQINASCSACFGNITRPILINDTGVVLGSDPTPQYIWCNYTVTPSVTTIGYLLYTNTTHYICANATRDGNVSMDVDQGNETDWLNPWDVNTTYVAHLNDTNANDSSIYGNEVITFNGDPTAQTGHIGIGVNFDGTGDSIELPNDTVTTYTRGTIMMWANVAEWNAAEFEGLAGDPNAELLFFYDGGGAGIRCNVDNLWGADFTQPTTGIFQHYAMTWDSVADIARCYVNGSVVSSFTDPFDAPEVTRFWVGSWLDGTSNNRCINATIDQVEIYNTTFTGDEINASYFNQLGTFNFTSLAAEENIVPVITIQSPEPITYLNQRVIPLTWSYTPSEDGNPCSQSWYNLDGGNRIFTNCLNSSITIDTSATHNITVSANDSIGGEGISDRVDFNFRFGNFSIAIFEEITGLPFNTSDMTLTFFCANQTEVVNLVQNFTQEILVNCSTNEAKLTLVDNASNTHSRSIIPQTFLGTLEYYMINQTKDTSIEQTWRIYDNLGLYSNGIVQVTKIIPSTGQKNITQQRIDAESNVVIFLIVGERYDTVSIFDSNFGNERNLGFLDASTATEIRFDVSNIPYAPDVRTTFRDVSISFGWNTTTRIIQAVYNDTLNQTTSVVFNVYNASNTTQVVFTSSSTSNVVTFTFNNVDVNQSYIAEVVAQHSRYGQIRESASISFSETGLFIIQGLVAVGLGPWAGVAAAFISLFVMLGFGKRYAKIGIAFSVLMMALFMYWGWFINNPQMTWGVIILLAFVSFIGVLTLGRRRNQ